MKSIGEQTGLTLAMWGGPGNMPKLMPGQPQQGPSAISGPYLITATRISRTRSVDLGGQVNPQQQFVVQLAVIAEPKIRVIRASGAAKVEIAVDEDGKSLVSERNEARYGYYAQATSAWNVTVPLTEPPHVGTRIARLKGTIDAEICTRFEHVEIEDLLGEGKNAQKTFGSTQLSVIDVAPKGAGVYEVRVRAALLDGSDGNGGAGGAAAGIPADQDMTRLPLHDIALVDAEGNALSRTSFSSSGSANRYEVTMQFNGQVGLPDPSRPRVPEKLVWDVPVEIKPVSIPFEFADLPIP
jgi:hypothetical protein